MRPGSGLNVTAVAAQVAAPMVARGGGEGHSGWHSPVPYLFGGLTAMLALIAFALLLLACSYWRLTRRLEAGRSGGGPDQMHDDKTAKKPALPAACCEEKLAVIMAGNEKPTYIATPMSSGATSFEEEAVAAEAVEEEEKKVEVSVGNGNYSQSKNDQNHGASDNLRREV